MSNKAKLRFNAIDLVIIILVVGCIAGLALRYQLINVIHSQSESNGANVSFYLSNIRSSSENYFNEGDTFFLANEDVKLGELLSGFRFEPAAQYNMRSDGTYVKTAAVNGRSDMFGTLKADGRFADSGEFLLNGTKYIAAGSELAIYSKNVEVTVIITDVTPIA